MKIKLFKAFGPLLLAAVVVGLLIFLPINVGIKYSKTQLTKFAQSPLNTPSFSGYAIKRQAFSNPEFLPLLGSSEMEHVNSFHPSSYFKKYPAGFTPYLVGQPGTTTLTHFFYINSISEELKNRKIVFVISPQWFSKQGMNEGEFRNFVSKGEIYSWMKVADPKASTTAQLAQRLLQFKSLEAEKTIYSGLKRLANHQALTHWQKISIGVGLQFWRKEDVLFSNLSEFSAEELGLSTKIKHFSKALPNHPTSDTLENLAIKQAEKNSDNNPFQINNHVWNRKLKSKYKKLENRKAQVGYTNSPEYSDFQQLLNTFAKNHNDVLFIIQPVNGAWSNYTGVSKATLEQFSTKIKVQLQDQGFKHIADFTDMYDTLYASGDTIHFGTRGWLAADQAIKKFMTQKSKVNYDIDNTKFLSKTWQSDDSE